MQAISAEVRTISAFQQNLSHVIEQNIAPLLLRLAQSYGIGSVLQVPSYRLHVFIHINKTISFLSMLGALSYVHIHLVYHPS
jgi:hypothetical protein